MIEVTDELLDKLYRAQLKHAQKMIGEELASPYPMTDDGYDYLTSALSLAERMMRFRFDSTLEQFGKFLNAGPDDGDGLQAYACDGIANAFYEINPSLLA